jgi:hypothetical protein
MVHNKQINKSNASVNKYYLRRSEYDPKYLSRCNDETVGWKTEASEQIYYQGKRFVHYSNNLARMWAHPAS